jgi:hypothetical protein
MAGIKLDRKELQDRLKKVFKKLFPAQKEPVPQLVPVPIRNNRNR